MADLIEKLGIDWRLLIFQIINFFILLWVLKRYAYKPILQALERRSKRISDSLEQAKKIEMEVAKLEQEKQRVLSEARIEAAAVVEKAKEDADAYLARNREAAKAETAVMVAAAQKEVGRIKDSVVAEARADLAELIVAGTERIIRVKLDRAADRKLLDDALKVTKD